MLTFFRRIRKGLLEGGATSKYLLYAIGEIALVVIGILIALQINNWNQWKKDRILEKEVLNDLADNLFRNEEQLQNCLMIMESYDSSAEIILNALQTGQTYSDTLNKHFFSSRYNGSIFVNISKDGYEALKSAGFEILSSSHLKDEILKLFESVYKSLEKVASWELLQLTNKGTVIEENFIYSSSSLELLPLNYIKLQDNLSYISLLRRVKSERAFIRTFLLQSLEENQRVFQLIKEELKEME